MSDLATVLRGMTDDQRAIALGSLSADELEVLQHHWRLFARPEQLPPGTAGASDPRIDWRVWLFLAARASGKTRSMAEAVRAAVESGQHGSICIAGPTADSIRRDQVEAILNCSAPWNRPQHAPSTRRIVWENGAVAYLLSSEEPDRPRGQNISLTWADELTSWAGDGADFYSNIQLALRVSGPLGAKPQMLISTTPKRHPLLLKIIADPATVITRGTTMSNARNLDPDALADLQRRYLGTSLGRQELLGELLLDDEGALWTRGVLDRNRVEVPPKTQRRCVVAVDPSGSARGDACGVVVMCVDENGTGYVLADYSGQYSPNEWANIAVNAYNDHRCDNVVCEKNFGGDLCLETIRTVNRNVPVKMVWASRGKAIRAQPIASLFEQNRIKLVGNFNELEDELTSWNPGGKHPSPNRLDALVWAATEVMTIDQVRPARFANIDWGRR